MGMGCDTGCKGEPSPSLFSPSVRWPEVKSQVPAVTGSVDGAKPGSYNEVSGSALGHCEINDPTINFSIWMLQLAGGSLSSTPFS
jgi:hypothetical protein